MSVDEGTENRLLSSPPQTTQPGHGQSQPGILYVSPQAHVHSLVSNCHKQLCDTRVNHTWPQNLMALFCHVLCFINLRLRQARVGMNVHPKAEGHL